ncbi:MAG: S41 family peptidase [Pyrinomonadaceae bacterium]
MLLGLVFTSLLILFSAFAIVAQEGINGVERSRNRKMLKVIKDEVADKYYDKNFHGVDFEIIFKAADARLKEVKTNSESFIIIAAFLQTLKDSHTYFLPPSRSVRVEHGWQMQMIGDKCLVVRVSAGSDAEKQNLKVGDQILGFEGMRMTREDYPTFRYMFFVLNPISEMNLLVQSPDGSRRNIRVAGKRNESFRVTDLTDYTTYINLIRESEMQAEIDAHRFIEIGDDLTIWKMPRFDLSKDKVDDCMDKVLKRKNLILDLRGNGGGYEETLLRLLGYFFDKNIDVGKLVLRNETKPMTAKTIGKNAYHGKVVALIDSRSGSAAEVFARVLQLENRGVVLGDISSGRVMRSRFYSKSLGADTLVFFGVSVTDADVVMTDGKSLENNGVKPDEFILPAIADLVAGRDPVLSRAAALSGVAISPEKAGTLFPYLEK